MEGTRPGLALVLAGLGSLALLAVPLSRQGSRGVRGPEPPPELAFDAGRSGGRSPMRVDGREVAAGEVLLELESWAELPGVEERLARLGARVLGGVPADLLLRVRLPAGAPERASFARLAKLDGVAGAEWNALGRGGSLTPDDTHFARQWHLANSGQGGGLPGADLGASAAWGIQRGDAGVVVAVLDSGVDPAHPELAGRVLPGWDFVDEDPDPSADHPHGIWVAGLLAANADNGFGVAGIDHGCSLLPLKVLDASCSGTTFDLVQALDRCVAEGVDVACLALVDYPGTRALRRALRRAHESGVILVACAGNGGLGDADASWPGASPWTLSIGFTDSIDLRHPSSATGDALDFVAPGSLLATISESGANTYASFTGCSAATPLAAGIVALLKAEVPGLTQADAERWLRAGAVDQVGSPAEDVEGPDPYHGEGRLSAHGSLAALCSCAGGEDLRASPPEIELAAGGRQHLRLDAGAAHAGRTFWLLGSHTGTSPGVPVHGVVLPLAWDGYLEQTFLTPNAPPLTGHVGLLDGEGRAEAQLVVPPGTSPSLTGLRLWHAYLVFDGWTAVHASGPVTVDLR